VSPAPPGANGAAPPRPERRRSRRIPFEAVVQYEVGEQEFIHLSSDISADGIFIKNFSPPPVGSELSLRVRLPDDLGRHELELLGRVVRIEGGAGEPPQGMGVAFTGVRAEHPEAVRFFVAAVYEMDQLRAAAPADDGADESDPAALLSGLDRALRLRLPEPAAPDRQPPALFADARQRWLWGGLLVLIGVLLGAAAVWVFGVAA
jgi:hypothetical protein